MLLKKIGFGPLIFFTLLLGFFSGVLFSRSDHSASNSYAAESRGKIIREGGYQFTNPILACDVAKKGSFQELKPLETKLVKLIDSKVKQMFAENISVYLRTLNSGRWFEINEEEQYAPASLMKTVVMIAYIKASESEPDILFKKITFTASKQMNDVPESGGNDHLVIGSTYSVEDLIHKMIVDSSNEALDLLISNFDSKLTAALNEVFADLNIPSPPSLKENNLDFMTAEQYSFIFRVLYGSTYLNRENSESALKILSGTNFDHGLAEGIPEKMDIAHKFGARSTRKNNKEYKEFHDCGIIYYPNHPYLLCVMTRGYDFPSLETAVGDISKLIYSELDTFFRSI